LSITYRQTTMGSNISWHSDGSIGYEAYKEYAAYLAKCIEHHTEQKDASVIDVGCGLGTTTHMLAEVMPERDVYGLDPKPESFERPGDRKKQKPRIATVNDLSDEEIAKCVAASIVWPYPNDSTYDMEAVEKLKPKFILTVVETTGGAGGQQFLHWLASCERDDGKKKLTIQERIAAGEKFSMTDMLLLISEMETGPQKHIDTGYTVVCEHGVHVYTGADRFTNTIMLLRRNGVELPDIEKPHTGIIDSKPHTDKYA